MAEVEIEEDSEDDTEDDFETPIDLEHSDGPHEDRDASEVVEDYREPLDKLRRVNKKFTNSGPRNDLLQELIKKMHGKEIKMQKEVKTRWNSTKRMMDVALPVIEELRVACRRLKIPWFIDEDDLVKLEELKTALKPMEFAINKIGKQDMNLIKAEGVYKTVVESLEKIDSDIAKSLKESFLNRVDDRRPVTLVHLILFLHNPDFLNQDEDWLGHTINKKEIFNLASEQIQRLFPDDFQSERETLMDVDQDGDTKFSEEEEDGRELTLDEQLEKRWRKDEQEAKAKTCKKGTKFVKDMCQNYARTGNPRDIPVLLKKLLDALKSIPPTSVQCERAFSTTGQYCTKLRTNLNDKTLSALVLLKHHQNKS